MISGNANTIEACMKERGDRPVLCLRSETEEAVMRYAVGVSDTHPHLYSIYAEYSGGGKETIETIPAFSEERDTAESFCAMLWRFGVTPLSLHAHYEDSLTP